MSHEVGFRPPAMTFDCFDVHRPLLTGAAHRTLGTASDAEELLHGTRPRRAPGCGEHPDDP